jgi:hypothetical protein
MATSAASCWEFSGSAEENWLQRGCPTLVSFGANDDRNHIDERQLNGWNETGGDDL